MKSAPDTLLAKSLNSTALLDYVELTKPGITMLVTSSMVIGFILGSTAGVQFGLLAHALIGTLLIAAGTAAHNQYIERDLDKLMLRTSSRPLPAEKIAPNRALFFSLTLIFSGLIYLIFMVNTAAGLVSAVTTLLYLGLYTPLKRVSFANVWVGSIPGALPAVGGWAAATGNIADPGMWVLFGIVFLWQIPHVVAIAWLCNEDYTRAGFRMLPKLDENGFKSALTIMACLVLILPVSGLLFYLGFNGLVYLAGAILGGLYFLYFGIKFTRKRDKVTAKKLMFASLIYLPVVWVFIILDKL
ncbi:MAG: heme o synthase, partial [Balneolales bacterium]